MKKHHIDYSDAYIFSKGTTKLTGGGTDVAARNIDARNKQVTFKGCSPFTNCTIKINNTQIDSIKDHDYVMPMYNLIIEDIINYAKILRTLWHYHKDFPMIT